MVRKKLKRKKEASMFPNVVLADEKTKLDNLLGEHFIQDRPIILELGCGTGVYTLSLAKLYPERNFIGIDIKLDRLWFGGKMAGLEKISNVIFIKLSAKNLVHFFKNRKIEEMWLTFPDPHPKRRHEKKRLTSGKYLEMYKKIIVPGGLVHLKTDDYDFFQYTICQLKNQAFKTVNIVYDLYSKEVLNLELNIKTAFERKHLRAGKKIFYLKFQVS